MKREETQKTIEADEVDRECEICVNLVRKVNESACCRPANRLKAAAIMSVCFTVASNEVVEWRSLERRSDIGEV